MEVGVYPFHIREYDLLSKYHLVESTDEEGVEESSVEDGKTNNSANEFEVVEMFWVDAGVRVDLQGVIVVSRVFKQTVERIKHLVREQEKEFPELVSDR